MFIDLCKPMVLAPWAMASMRLHKVGSIPGSLTGSALLFRDIQRFRHGS